MAPSAGIMKSGHVASELITANRTVRGTSRKDLEDQTRVKKRKRKLLARTEKGQPFIPQRRSVAGLIPDDFGVKYGVFTWKARFVRFSAA
jgi:hypothetical protein